MKKILLLVSLCLFSYAEDIPVYEYDPFVQLLPIAADDDDNESEVKPIVLSAILSNKAYIDGEWHKVGDEFREYNITHIGNGKVELKNKKETITLNVGGERKKVLEIKDRK